MMMRSRLYTVHLNPADPKPYESAVFVPDGFYISAFVFQFLWALYHRLWLPALLFFVLQAASVWTGELLHLSKVSQGILKLGAAWLIAVSAHDMWRGTLDKRGWVISDVVIAPNLLEAQRRYFDRHFVPAANLGSHAL